MAFRLGAAEIAAAIKGSFRGAVDDSSFAGVSIDSRSVAPGELFFAIRGINFDGHGFVREAIEKGAYGAVVERGALEGEDSLSLEEAGLFVVEDTTRALGDLAAFVRALKPLKLIAVSGTSGKTTTKDMAALILKKRNPLKTEGNKNNLFGLPLTLLRLDPSNGVAVVELGISEPGEMKRLAAIARPDVGVITNVGLGHIESLSTLERTAGEKGSLFRGLGKDGVMVVNLDDPWTVKIAGAVTGPGRITFSTEERADVSVSSVEIEGLSSSLVSFDVMGRALKVRLPAAGRANVSNAAAAIGAALALEASLEEMKEGLSSFVPAAGRLALVRVGPVTVIDDTYNANPDSVRAALSALAGASGRKVAVLGDMLELGEHSTEEHLKAGALAVESGVDLLLATGRFAHVVVDGAVSAGMDARKAVKFQDKAETIAALGELVHEGDTVLVKGSRGAAMEDVVAGLRAFLKSRGKPEGLASR